MPLQFLFASVLTPLYNIADEIPQAVKKYLMNNKVEEIYRRGVSAAVALVALDLHISAALALVNSQSKISTEIADLSHHIQKILVFLQFIELSYRVLDNRIFQAAVRTSRGFISQPNGSFEYRVAPIF